METKTAPQLLAGVPTLGFSEFSAAFHGRAAEERIPVSAMVELTYRCNFDCVHCYVVDPRSSGELSTAELRRILGELREAGTLFLTFTGGEPLARPDFEELWVAARELGFLVTLFTNAALVKDRTLRLFERYPPHKVEVTLYGGTEAGYRAVTRRRNVRQLVLDNVDRLRALGIPVYLKAVGVAGNVDETEALLAEARARGVEGYFKLDNQITARTDCRRGPVEHRLAAEEVVAQDRRDPRRIAEFRRLYLRTRGRRFVGDRRLFRCGAGKTSVVVDPFGRLQTCTLYRGDAYDLRRGSVTEGWRRHLQAVVRRPTTRPTRCRTCDKVSLCGSCPGHNSLESGGDPEEPPDFLCAIAYARVEAFMDDLRPRVPEPAGRWLPVHRARECPRPWLATHEPLGELVWLEGGAAAGRPRAARPLPVVGSGR